MFQKRRVGIPAATSENIDTTTQTTTIARLNLKLPNHAASEIGKR
jgi:hypothetical protein